MDRASALSGGRALRRRRGESLPGQRCAARGSGTADAARRLRDSRVRTEGRRWSRVQSTRILTSIDIVGHTRCIDNLRCMKELMTLIDLTAAPSAATARACRACPSRSSVPDRSVSRPPRIWSSAASTSWSTRRATDRRAACRPWGHIRLFSPWKHLVDPARERLLEETGWTAPAAGRLPTGAELVDDYLAPLAALACDRLAHPRRRRGDAVTPRGHGPHPHGGPRTDPVPAAGARRRRRRGGRRPAR